MTLDGGRAFVFAIKGQSGSGELWPRAHSKATAKAILWPIRVDVGKEQIYGRLSIAEPGPGYVHFPMEADLAYFQGLTAEKVVPKVNKKGFTERAWVLRRAGMRNEPLDCAVMAYAALCGLRAQGYDLETAVAELALRPVISESECAVPETPKGPSMPTPAAPARAPVESGWLGDTRGWLR